MDTSGLSLFVCFYVCLNVCLHVCMFACLHVCTFVCLYVCLCVLREISRANGVRSLLWFRYCFIVAVVVIIIVVAVVAIVIIQRYCCRCKLSPLSKLFASVEHLMEVLMNESMESL